MQTVLGLDQMQTQPDCPLVIEMRRILERAKERGDCNEAISLIEQAIEAQKRGPAGTCQDDAFAEGSAPLAPQTGPRGRQCQLT